MATKWEKVHRGYICERCKEAFQYIGKGRASRVCSQDCPTKRTDFYDKENCPERHCQHGTVDIYGHRLDDGHRRCACRICIFTGETG